MSGMMLIDGMKCEYCGEPAEAIVERRDRFCEEGEEGLHAACSDCAEKIVKEGYPEYIVDCPNCNCRFGVN